jgi:DNA transformation protein
MSKKELMQCMNIGERIANRLIDVGIKTPQDLQKIGTEEAFIRNFEKYGWEKGMCSCYLYALEGAITGKKWNKIPEKRKTELRDFVKKIRQNL